MKPRRTEPSPPADPFESRLWLWQYELLPRPERIERL
jgi:hypothetical protein